VARFSVGRPITTREAFIEVDPGLRTGTLGFQLEVETGDGRVSRPDVVTVTVVDRITDPFRNIVGDVIRNNPNVIR
jgi:hypothetical protein